MLGIRSYKKIPPKKGRGIGFSYSRIGREAKIYFKANQISNEKDSPSYTGPWLNSFYAYDVVIWKRRIGL
jgi:hypothetical protein